MNNRSRYYNTDNMRIDNRRNARIARTAVVRRERHILVMLFIIALLVSFMFLTLRVKADNNKSSNNSVKMYKSVMVYAGDTLETIAERYMTEEYSSEVKYINEVSSINGFTADFTLTPGNKIIVPYYMSKSISSNPVIEISLVN